ncbi:macrolide family glycosyltransferase [Kutzneria sp. NPDC051319]|uniref:macrolide family glycosyltransferase n=1 Tax=Kutzneria sp. NPDC051319 TaxID=3155047 RepID=UPI0034301345
MGYHVLLLTIPANGHVFPTLALASELVRRGHRVTYPTMGGFVSRAESVGATVLPYDSVDPVSVVGGENSGQAPLLFLKESLALIDAAATKLSDDVPDVVVYDNATLQAGRVLSRRFDRPGIQLYPVFASNEHYSFVMAMMKAAGPVDLATPAMAEFGGLLAGMIAENGFDEDIPTFMGHVEDLNVVLVPRAFQPAGDTFDQRFAFVGPCLADRSFLGEWQPPASGLPVALVSLGTVNNRNESFFRATIDAFAGLDWHAVISVGNGIDPAALGQLPDNVEVHRWLQHLDVLEHAGMAITHAGMGGVMEALRFGRPMIAVPPFPDVIPNGDRLADLGLGVVLRPADVTAETMRAAVLQVAADAEFTERAQLMAEEIRRAGGAAEAATLIENRLASA